MPPLIRRSAIALITCNLVVACIAPTGSTDPTSNETASLEADPSPPAAREPSHGTFYDCTEWVPVPEVVRHGRLAAICSAWVAVPGTL